MHDQDDTTAARREGPGRLTRRRLALGVGAVATIAAVVAAWASTAPEDPSSQGRASPQPAGAPATRYPDIPRIDMHVHVAPRLADRALRLLGERHVRMALNASGGTPRAGLPLSQRVAERTEGRLQPYCNIAFTRVRKADWKDYVHGTLEQCKRMGAVGLKIYKSLGLGIQRADGRLLRIDDPRLDVVFETAGELDLPVLIHSGDPQAFFRPPTPDNERYEELQAHPDWSFHGERGNGMPWPSWEEIFEQFRTRVERHPNTTFIGAHFGNAAEQPERVADMLEANPNYYVGIAARIPELGRHSPERMRAIFRRYQDRILFGTDFALTPQGLTLGSRGEEHDPPGRVPEFFRAHWRYFETRDENMAHPTPIQGDWTIDGIGLSRDVLEKIYWRNAARLFDLQPDWAEGTIARPPDAGPRSDAGPPHAEGQDAGAQAP